jgi:hypothetical protein
MSRVAGVDLGTMFFQVAEKSSEGKIVLKNIRNAFVELEASEENKATLSQNDWQYVEDDNHFYIIGEDALRVARMFPGKVELRRPLQDGVLNKGETKKLLVLRTLIARSLGQAPDDKSVVCACISSPSADDSPDSTYHKARITGMLKQLGWNVKIIEEGHAVVLSERPVVVDSDGKESPYSGIGISFGAGRCNCVLAYKGLSVVGMSVARSGDWLDKMVAEATDADVSKIIGIKEKKLDFTNIDEDDDVIFALNTYYTALIQYVFNHFARKFSQVKSEFDAPLDVILAGGTSMPKGFCSKVKEVVSELDLPFKINEVRHSDDARNSVVKGCLVKALLTQKGIESGKEDKKLNDIIG